MSQRVNRDAKLSGTSRGVTILAILIGIALVVGTATSTHWLLSTPEELAPAKPEAERVVVCLGHADLPHGVAALFPMQSGRVVELPVPEGETVEPETILLRLDDTLAKSQLREAEAALRGAEVALEEARKAPSRLRLKIDQQKAAVEAAEKRVVAAERMLEHRRKLRKLNQLTEELLEAAEQQLLEARAVEKVERIKLQELKEIDPLTEQRTAEAEVEVLRAKVEQAREALEQFEIRAPERGQILRRNVAVGDLTGASSPRPPLVFAPDEPLIIRAEVEQEFLGQVREGMPARVRDHVRADTHTWTGRVERISDWITRRRSILFEPGEINDVRTAECIITLDPAPHALRIGQRVRVLIEPTGSEKKSQ